MTKEALEAHARSIVYDYQALVEEYFFLQQQPPRLFIIMRGLPGSGRTTLGKAIARQALERNLRTVFCSADHLFQVDNEYQYDMDLLSEAHAMCFNECQEELGFPLHEGSDIVIVNNTSIRTEDLDQYIQLYRYPDKLVVVAFECPRHPCQATTLLTRANQNGRHIPTHSFMRWYDTWRATWLDPRNNYFIKLQEFIGD